MGDANEVPAQQLMDEILKREQMWPRAGLERLPATVIYALIKEIGEDLGLRTTLSEQADDDDFDDDAALEAVEGGESDSRRSNAMAAQR